MKAPLRVAVVEDEDLFRSLLCVALSELGGFEVVGAFSEGASAAREIPRLKPHLALLDIELGQGPNGIALGLELKRGAPDLGIVLLSNHRDVRFLDMVTRGEARGWSYLLKRSVQDVDALRRALNGAAAGFLVLDRQLFETHVPDPGLASSLGPKGLEILRLLAQGYSNGAIARQLSYSEKYIENQLGALYERLCIDTSNPNLNPRVQATLRFLNLPCKADP